MKIEKTNKNTLKILLTIEELSLRDLTIEDIEKGKKKAQNFFFDIIEESSYADDFLQENIKLLVEASISSNDNLIVRITKIDYPQNLNHGNYNSTYQMLGHNLFIFKEFKNLILFSKQAEFQDLFCGTNSLHKYNGLFLLEFSKATTKNCNFLRTHAVINEFCDYQLSKSSVKSYIGEHGITLINNNALSTLVSYVLE